MPSEEGGQPRASWDSVHGHWDFNPGNGGPRQRFDPKAGP